MISCVTYAIDSMGHNPFLIHAGIGAILHAGIGARRIVSQAPVVIRQWISLFLLPLVAQSSPKLLDFGDMGFEKDLPK